MLSADCINVARRRVQLGKAHLAGTFIPPALLCYSILL